MSPYPYANVRYQSFQDTVSSVTITDGVKHVQLATGTEMDVPDSGECADIQSGATVLVDIKVYPNGSWSPVAISKVKTKAEAETTTGT